MKTAHYQFSKLSDQVKEGLVDDLVQWGRSVFQTTPETLRGYWLEKKSFETSLYTLRTDEGTLVGSATLKHYRVNYEGKDIVIVKGGLGVLPQYRGNKFTMRCLMSEVVRLKLAHGRHPMYVFSTLIHPVTYKLFCDMFNERFYPHFKHPDNPEMRKMALYLAEVFGLEKADSPYPFVCKERFSALETQQTVEYWRNSKRPEVRFFVDHCPKYYCSDDCLIGLAPLQMHHMLPLMARAVARNSMEKLRGKKARFN